MSEILWLLELVQQIFGNDVIKWVIIILLPFALLFALMWLIKAIIEITRTTFIPLFYNSEQKRRIRRRQLFADHIESEIRRLNQREDWSDFRFAELEAEVEMEGTRKAFSFIPFIKRSSSGLRREKSLSKALKKSQERIILLEGDAGSGKSVALRHVALDIARRAIKSQDPVSLIPFYINLKDLRREIDQQINRQTIESCVIKSLKRINDRDVDKFIDDEFQTGLENGSWFFLFDSFDEIPEILGAEDADSKIREYAEAISDFLHGLNTCRGVVASRHFKGPSQVDWSHFKILNLTRARQGELIKHSELKPISEKLLLGNLESAKPEVQRFATNPLFLGLLIGYVQSHDKFPEHSDVVFDAYINRRLTQDKERVMQRFELSTEEIRQIAEVVAFCMAASQDLGLSPTRKAIKKSCSEQSFIINDRFDKCLDALEFMKLARSDNAEIIGDERVFTFSHRRFQEYFPTKLVLNKGNIAIRDLLTNPRWRETTVVICQTQPLEVVLPIIKEAWMLLNSFWEKIELQLHPIIEGNGTEIPIEFPWPQSSLHLLNLLQDGFSNRIDLLPAGLRKRAGVITSLATLMGSLPHRIWALEVSGIVPASYLLEIIRPAIEDKSQFLSDRAYYQVARLDNIPDDVRAWIKRSILKNLLGMGIFRGSNVVYAQVSRLVNSKEYVAVLRGIQFGYWIDIISSIMIAVILFVSAFTVPLGDKFFAGAITYRAIILLSGFLALMLPFTVFSEDQTPSSVLRVMYVGVILSFFVPVILLLKGKFYLLIPVLYAPFVMSSILDAVDDIPFEKSIIYFLLSPFFLLRKGMRYVFNLFKSSKVQFSRGCAVLFVIFATSIILIFISYGLMGSDNASVVFLVVGNLAMIVMFYRISSHIIREAYKPFRAWRKWLREPVRNMTVEEIIDKFSLFSIRYAYKFVAAIRVADLLNPSRESHHFVNQFIRLVENPSLENEFALPLTSFLNEIRRSGNTKYKSMLLDELFQLVEKMNSKLR
jgi:hypothetical protein